MNDEVLPPESFPQYQPPKLKPVRQATHAEAKPLLKLFSRMVKRGKYRSQSMKPRPKKKVRIV